MRRGYIRSTWDFGSTREVEEKHNGNYGAPGQGRKRKRDPTPEDIARQNQWRRERDIRRLIKWNFRRTDYWVTLTYRKGERPSWEEMAGDVQEAVRKMRIRYKKQDQELKYIYRLGIGKKGGPHVHILINRIPDTVSIIQECWTHGHINIRPMDCQDDCQALAEYIAKPLEEHEPDKLKRFHPSRNLIRKEPEEKKINRRALVDQEGKMKPIIPPKGYYVDIASVRFGRNPVTGFFYRHYTLVKLDRRI